MMRNLIFFGRSLVMVLVLFSLSGCATPDGLHRLAASMGSKVEGPFPLPDDYVLEYENEMKLIRESHEHADNDDFSSDPFLELAN